MVNTYLKVPTTENSDQKLVELRYQALIYILEYKVACQSGFDQSFKAFLKSKDVDFKEYNKTVKYEKINSKIIRSYYLSDMVLENPELEKELLAVFHKVIKNVASLPSFDHIVLK